MKDEEEENSEISDSNSSDESSGPDSLIEREKKENDALLENM